MQPEMDLEAALCSKQLLTDLALEVLHTRMCFCVSCQCALDSKRPEAVPTLIWFFMRVYTHMSHYVTGLLELLCAVDTLMPLHTIHLYHTARSHIG